MPVVEGADGLMIEADEAGQRVTPVVFGNVTDPVRQEGPVSWSREGTPAHAAAKAAAEEAGTSVTPAVDGNAEIRKMSQKPAAPAPAPAVVATPAPALPAPKNGNGSNGNGS